MFSTSYYLVASQTVDRAPPNSPGSLEAGSSCAAKLVFRDVPSPMNGEL